MTQQDNEAFSEYLQKKSARDEQQKQATRRSAAAQRRRKLNRRSLLTWAAGTAVVGEAVTLGYPMVTGQNIPPHGLQHGGATYTEAQRHPIDRELVNPQARHGRPAVRRMGAADADQDRRRHLCGQPQYRPGARLDLVLELRRLQPDLAPPLRLPERRPGEGLRMDQQHPGRQEFADLRHPHQHRDAGRRLQHLPRPLRRRPDGADGERRRDDGAGPRRPRDHRSQDRRALFRHRRAEGHRGVLRPADLAGHRGAQIRLGAQRPQPGRRLAEGRRAQDLQDLSRHGDRQIRLSRHQGPEDRMGNGADGRAVRRGGNDPRRRHPFAVRRRRHHLASERPLGVDRRAGCAAAR